MKRLSWVGGGLAVLVLTFWVGTSVWVDRVQLPQTDPALSVVVEDRDGHLLRAFTVEEGRWRLPVSPREVDPKYLS